MRKTFKPIKSIELYAKAYELESVPRVDTQTNIMYHEYFQWCLNNNLGPSSIGVLTRELKRFGYHRISARINNKVTKVYRYTGQKDIICPACQGLGMLQA